MLTITEIDDLVHGEQFERAQSAINELLTEPTLDEKARWRLLLRQARRTIDAGETAVDESILILQELLQGSAPEATEIALAHAVLIEAYVDKRCPELAQEAISTARQTVGEALEILLAEGECALRFDDRLLAQQLYQRARELHPHHGSVRRAMANLLYVVGDFAGCQQQLEAIAPTDPAWPRAIRLRAAAFSARQEFGAEAEQWQAILARLPDGDNAMNDRIALALALASAGHYAEALEQFRRAWQLNPTSPSGRYARERIEYLEKAGAHPAQKRLAAFPTTQQKWNYCGPAVLELCLRYLDIELGQDEIAQTVKRTTGTPMYEMVHYLAERGVVARRIEATPTRLKAAIDLGLPVIVQEEYSTTSHVAVITGYDEALGLFIANDPMTHRQSLRSYRWTELAGNLFGNGGLIILGRQGSSLGPIITHADEAGLVEAAHLSILDECDRRRPKPGSEEVEDTAMQRVIQLCKEAITLCPSFKLAYCRLWNAENYLYQVSGDDQLRGQVLARLLQVRRAFSHDEWPHQLHGRWLMQCGLLEEAFIAFFEASRRDPEDANNLQDMGECKWLAGDLSAAEHYMLRALAKEPYHQRAAENLAGVYLRQLEAIAYVEQAENNQGIDETKDNAADESNENIEDIEEVKDNSIDENNENEPLDILRAMPPSEITTPLERRPAELLRRGLHFNRVACTGNPDNPYNHEVRGALLSRSGNLIESIASFRRARVLNEDRGIWGLAQALVQHGQDDEAKALLEEGCSRFWRRPQAWLALATFLFHHQSPQEAGKVLEQGMHTLHEGHGELVQLYFHVLSESESAEAAAARLRQIAEARPGDDELAREVAYLLDEEGQRGHAVALLRHVLEVCPSDVGSLYRLGMMLSEDLLTREEGRQMLEQVLELAPDAARPRRQLAWLYLETDPARGLEILAPVLDQEDPYVHETQAMLLTALGRQTEAAAAWQQALDVQSSPEEGMIRLCAWHINGNRYPRAIELAQRFMEQALPQDLRQTAMYYWLTAHRLGGAIKPILPRIREICSPEVPEDLAWEVYYACRSIDHQLAAAAALVYAASVDDEKEQLEWRINAAGELAQCGDETMLEEIRHSAGDNPQAWAELSSAYANLKRFDEANTAAQKAYALAPTNRRSLTVMEEAAVRLNQPQEALRYAEQLLELHPYEHQGPERLGILHAKLLQVEDALAYSLRAVDAAPYCHISHRSRALALFVAHQFAEARHHAGQALALEEPDQEDAPDDSLLVLRAIEGDSAGLKRCLANLAREEPVEVFAQFKDHLRQIAEHSRNS